MRSILPAGGLSTAGIGVTGAVVPGKGVGMMAGLGSPSPDASSADGLTTVCSQGSNILSTVEKNNSRILEAKLIPQFERNRDNVWSALKDEIEQRASLYDFGGGLARNPPICVNLLNEPELLRFGVCPDDIKRARFAYISLIDTVKDGVGRHTVFKSKSPPIAWRALEEHFPPKTSGSEFDILTEFNNQRCSRGEDRNEYRTKLEDIQEKFYDSPSPPQKSAHRCLLEKDVLRFCLTKIYPKKRNQ